MANRRQLLGGKRRGIELMLTKTVPNLGSEGEVVTVKPGYARNYLLPNGMATIPTPHALRVLERHRVKIRALAEKQAADLRALAEELSRHSVSIEANANEDGHLYGSVVPSDIAKSLQGSGFAVEADQVNLEGPLRELGLYTVNIQLASEVATEIKVWVVPSQVEK